jgi:hypothetical protein
MDQLKADHQGYDLYYSGRRAVPSALLFVPQQGSIQWILQTRQPGGWKRIEDESTFIHLLTRLNDTDTGVAGNQLKVVVPPGDIPEGGQDLCLIYTAGSTACYRQGEEEKTYVLPPVPERTKRDYDRNK